MSMYKTGLFHMGIPKREWDSMSPERRIAYLEKDIARTQRLIDYIDQHQASGKRSGATYNGIPVKAS